MKQQKNERKTSRRSTSDKAVSPEQRQHMIAEAAYYRAEQRGFQGGNPQQDWLESEAEIDKLLTA